jgi:hypothetical protein
MSQLCLFDVALVSESCLQTPDADMRAVCSKPSVTKLLGPTTISQHFQVSDGHIDRLCGLVDRVSGC